MALAHAGELAALGTAACWTLTALSFEAAGRRIGSLSVNVIRLALASVMLAVWGGLVRGVWLPLDATPHAWAWLSVSGLVGLVLGDFLLFRAFVLVGPRLSALVMSAVPVWTGLVGWALLDETPSLLDAVGTALVVGGIGWAVSERTAADAPARPGRVGLACAVGASLGQAVGLVLSKHGMGDYDAFAATQIRVLVGAAGFAVVCTLARWWPRVRAAAADRTALGLTAVGAVFGPFLGVGLSLLAIQLAENTGVAAAIMATTPIMLIPIAFLRREQVGVGGIAGAVLAVGGMALLFST